MLRLDGIAKSWPTDNGEFTVTVESLLIPQGSTFAILGDSGTGKSTLLNLLSLALAPTTAERFEFSPARGIVFDLGRLWREGRRDALSSIRGRFFGYVPQTGGLLPFLSVRENIALPQRISGRIAPHVILGLAERLGITDQLRRKPRELSVGQRQRVAVARALSHRPKLVLADEPTASVQATLARDIMRLLIERSAATGAALIVATHSPELVDEFRMTRLLPSFTQISRNIRVTFCKTDLNALKKPA